MFQICRERNIIFFIFLLLAVNFVAHFIPFERSSIAPDDYSILSLTRTVEPTGIKDYLLIYPDRPLGYIFLDLQSKIVGDNPKNGLFFIFFSSMFGLILVFLLLKKLLSDDFSAFIATLIFSILPNKLEVYHAPIYANLSIIMGMYIASLLFFVYFIEKHKRVYLFLSLFLYFIAIFSYEVGFLLPFIMMLYAFIYSRSLIRYVLYFAVPFILFLIYRLTGAFGLADMGRGVSLFALPMTITELFHQFFGRYMIRNILYGFYKFFSVQQPWLSIIIFSNFVILVILALILKKRNIKKIDLRLLLLAIGIFVFFLIPIMVHSAGGVGSRHLVLPSVGVSIFIVWLLEKANRYWKIAFIIFTGFLIFICSGNAWTQVIACRINGAVYETLKEKKDELNKADRVVIDTKSFADEVPFTWIQRDFNVLNTYYGAQVFEDWGLKSMVKLISQVSEGSIYIAKKRPILVNNKSIEITIFDSNKYRTVSEKLIILPVEGIVVIDFWDVYRNGFNNGIRGR